MKFIKNLILLRVSIETDIFRRSPNQLFNAHRVTFISCYLFLRLKIWQIHILTADHLQIHWSIQRATPFRHVYRNVRRHISWKIVAAETSDFQVTFLLYFLFVCCRLSVCLSVVLSHQATSYLSVCLSVCLFASLLFEKSVGITRRVTSKTTSNTQYTYLRQNISLFDSYKMC